MSDGSFRRLFPLTLAAALLMLLAIELHSPYYFLQDDNLEYYLPVYVHNWRSLLDGELPLYNFTTFAGVPHASMGQTAPFYVPQYLALFLSQSIWGHPFAAIDLMSILHALVAVAGGYMLLRHLGASNTAASFGGLAALSGFFLWVGRAWVTATMLSAWFPWMLWAGLRYAEKPSYRRAAWLLSVRLALLYGGHEQFFVLAMLFEHAFTLIYLTVDRSRSVVRRSGLYLALAIPTALLGLPVLLPLSAEVGRSLARSQPLPYDVFSSMSMPLLAWLWGQLFVFITLTTVSGIGPSVPFLAHIGYVPTFLSVGSLELWRQKLGKRAVTVACTCCLLVALFWGANLFGPALYYLPIFNRFRWPFRLVYFTGFFQCLLAGFVIDLLRKKWQRLAFAGFCANWLLVFCLGPGHSWRVRDYHPPLRSPWEKSLANGRYVIVGGDTQAAVSPAASRQFVGFNYAELWGLDNLLGYEPLLSRYGAGATSGRGVSELELYTGDYGYTGTYGGPVDSRFVEHLGRWGVRYVLLSPESTGAASELIFSGFRLKRAQQGWALWEDRNVLPRVRWTGIQGLDAGEGLSWTEHVNHIDVYLKSWPTRELTMAFVANPGLQTCIADRCTPVVRTADGLIRVVIPRGTTYLRLVYTNALLAFAGWIALLTLGLFFGFWIYSTLLHLRPDTQLADGLRSWKSLPQPCTVLTGVADGKSEQMRASPGEQ